MYKQLLGQLQIIIDIFNGKSNEPNLQMQFATFNEGCLRGNADKLTEKQKEKLWKKLAEITRLFEDRGMPTFMVDESIEVFNNAVGTEEETPGFRGL